ncbi:hypothetical protein [Segetibacter aerophilus]|uniref:Uncharacterized protein n=1 Tax=Segetibacter aerophilus TaxID=670293 RepID=A0A512B8F1_9BACT|nr:hypothetical protein [Segetibacter aerophilus]GEO08238.1 hypothetical protein SAE01_07340 [Segetibacter aerophilus]
MLLQLENNHRGDVDKLLEFAKQNNLKLSVVDESDAPHLPGKPLTNDQVNLLIEKSRKSGMISLQNAHQQIRESFNAD